MTTSQDYVGFVAADIAITLNTTLANITGLVHAIGANSKWGFQAVVQFNLAGILSGHKFDVAVPASPTNHGYNIDVLNGTGLSIASIGMSAAVGGALAQTGLHLARFSGVIENGANAGNLAIQAAQNASDASALTIKRGSWLRVWALA